MVVLVVAGRDDPMGLFQPKWFCDALISMVYLLAAEGQAGCGVSGACPVPSPRLQPHLHPRDQPHPRPRGLWISSPLGGWIRWHVRGMLFRRHDLFKEAFP